MACWGVAVLVSMLGSLGRRPQETQEAVAGRKEVMYCRGFKAGALTEKMHRVFEGGWLGNCSPLERRPISRRLE